MQELVSKRVQGMQTSEIIRLSVEVNKRIKAGEEVFNLTIGDFDSAVFPIPVRYKELIQEAYNLGLTNYPPQDGLPELRDALAELFQRTLGLTYQANDFLVAGGGRPLIYGLYQSLVDRNDPVIYPVPSWNNNFYVYLTEGVPIELETRAEDFFMPTAAQIAPHVRKAALLALCSPQNPTGTMFREGALAEICDLVLAENEQRAQEGRRPLYVMYDQMYWMITPGPRHITPVHVRPAMKDFTIFVDGASKAFAATGVRVGWAVGPTAVIQKMRGVVAHMGAWSPKPEQWATAQFLRDHNAMDGYLTAFKTAVSQRLEGLYQGFSHLKSQGLWVDCIAPEGAIYLTVKFALQGKKTPDGTVLHDVPAVTDYLLNAAGLGVVPFYAFGASTTSDWYRISVGTIHLEALPQLFVRLEKALADLR
jgi:aspartate aminotransferase